MLERGLKCARCCNVEILEEKALRASLCAGHVQNQSLLVGSLSDCAYGPCTIRDYMISDTKRDTRRAHNVYTHYGDWESTCITMCLHWRLTRCLMTRGQKPGPVAYPFTTPPNCPVWCTALPLLRLWLILWWPGADMGPISPSKSGGSMAARARSVIPSAVKMLSYGALCNATAAR